MEHPTADPAASGTHDETRARDTDTVAPSTGEPTGAAAQTRTGAPGGTAARRSTAARTSSGAPAGAGGEAADAAPDRRPGVPMEAQPTPAAGAHWRYPERQPGSERHPHHAGIPRATPVVGTAQPLRGASGLIRQRAYRVPEHYARHWALLMLADRVDVLEDRLGDALATPLRNAGMVRLGARVEGNPLAALAVVAGAAWFIRKVL